MSLLTIDFNVGNWFVDVLNIKFGRKRGRSLFYIEKPLAGHQVIELLFIQVRGK